MPVQYILVKIRFLHILSCGSEGYGDGLDLAEESFKPIHTFRGFKALWMSESRVSETWYDRLWTTYMNQGSASIHSKPAGLDKPYPLSSR